MSKFKVGDKVRFVVKNYEDAKSAFQELAGLVACVWPGWSTRMERYAQAESILEVIHPSRDGLYLSVSPPDGTGFVVLSVWMELAEKKERSNCTCNLRFGCSCGQMKAEMLAKGYIRCRYTRLWVKVEE